MTDFSDAIRREDTETKGRYVYSAGPGRPEAELTFSKLGTTQIIIDHTEVPEACRGQSVGVALVERAVADLRKAGVTITPLCPFAAGQFRRHAEWHDVLAR